MREIKKGDIVSRNSYGNDIIFSVKRIIKLANKKEVAILKGIVTEYGGVLCHAAIVSREYGIPAIVSATGIMNEIRDGEKITINASTLAKRDMNVDTCHQPCAFC